EKVRLTLEQEVSEVAAAGALALLAEVRAAEELADAAGKRRRAGIQVVLDRPGGDVQPVALAHRDRAELGAGIGAAALASYRLRDLAQQDVVVRGRAGIW